MKDKPVHGVRKGAWSAAEDALLRKCIETYGEGKWHLVPLRAGLNRCRKSCRLRWLNYLCPNINRSRFSQDEVDLVIRLHKLLGNRWTLIAGRLPGRTANAVKNFWNSHIHKKAVDIMPTIIKPKPLRLCQSQNAEISTAGNPIFLMCENGKRKEVEAIGAEGIERNAYESSSNCWFSDMGKQNPCVSFEKAPVLENPNFPKSPSFGYSIDENVITNGGGGGGKIYESSSKWWWPEKTTIYDGDENLVFPELLDPMLGVTDDDLDLLDLQFQEN